jgi:hypothetical protein
MSIGIEQHLPGLWQAAEDISARGQREYRRLIGGSLLLLVLAAIGGMIDRPWAGWISAGAFAASTVTATLWVMRQAENDWYDGRAAAESAKSLAFKYAVGGEPFEITNADAPAEFDATLDALVKELRHLGSEVRAPATAPDLSELDHVRSLGLDTRQEMYRSQRVEEQRDWYARRAGEHRRAGHAWQALMIALNLAGIAGASLKGAGVIDFDLLSLFATMAAAVAAWLTGVDHLRIARAYDFAAIELDSVLARLNAMRTEAKWATFVADAEQTMSREHTMWQARRREL